MSGLWFIFCLREIPKYKPPGAYIRKGLLSEAFFRFNLKELNRQGLIYAGVYFPYFTVFN